MIKRWPKTGENWTVLVLTLTFLVWMGTRFVFWYAHPLLVGADQSVYLESAQLILKGLVPYRDFFDFNPPLIMYINVVPVVMAQLLGWPSSLGLSISVLSLHLAMLLFSSWLVYKNSKILRPLLFLPLLFVFAYFNLILVSDFGQREHLFLLVLFPYFILRGLRHFGGEPGRISSILMGLLTGLMMSMKPQYAFLVAAAEIGFLVESNNWKLFLKPEVISLFVPPAIYAACFFCLPADALAVFWGHAMKAYVYGSNWGGRSFMHMLCGFFYFTEPMTNLFIGLFVYPLLRKRTVWLTPIVMVSLAAMFNYIYGGQAWTYRILPQALFAMLLLALELALLMAPLYAFLSTRVKHLSLLCTLGFVVYVWQYVSYELQEMARVEERELGVDLAFTGLNKREERTDFDETFFSMLQNSNRGEKVIYMGSGIRPGYPAQLLSKNPPGSRYMYTYLLTMLDQSRRNKPELAKEFDQVEKEMIANLGQDILKNKPTLIYVQDCPIDDIIKKHDFYERYMQGYSPCGAVEGSHVYRYTGSKVVMARITQELRLQVVLDTITGKLSDEEASQKYHVPLPLVVSWRGKAMESIKEALLDRDTNVEQILKHKISELETMTWQQNQELRKLSDEIIELKKVRVKSDSK